MPSRLCASVLSTYIVALSMEWLVKASEEYRSQLRKGPFFKSLARAERANDLQWIHQLIHQSREFTQALCLRYSLCHDRRYQQTHAVKGAFTWGF